MSEQHLAFGQSAPSDQTNELSGDNFVVALKIIQNNMDSRSKKMRIRLKSAEEHVKSLQLELEESQVLDIYNDLGDSISELNKIKSKLQLSEKRSNIAQNRLKLSEIREKDLKYRSISLEQVMQLYQHRLSTLELKNKACEEQNRATCDDLNRTKLNNNDYVEENKAIKDKLKWAKQELNDAMKVVNESVECVEVLEAKIQEKEASLKFTQQQLSKASEMTRTAENAAREIKEEKESSFKLVQRQLSEISYEAQIADNTAKELKASLIASEKKQMKDVANLTNQLHETRRENKSLIEALQSSGSSSSTSQNPRYCFLKKTQSRPSSAIAENQCSSCLEDTQHVLPSLSQSSEDSEERLKEFKTCLDVVCAQLNATETLLDLERKVLEALQESTTAAESTHTTEMAGLHNQLQEVQRENNFLKESIRSLKSSAAQQIEVPTNNIAELETANKCRVSVLEIMPESEKRNYLQSLVTTLQDECTSLRLDNELIDIKLRCCRKELTKKEEHIVDLESLLSDNDEKLCLKDSHSTKNTENRIVSVAKNSEDGEFNPAQKHLGAACTSLDQTQMSQRHSKERNFEPKQSDIELAVIDCSTITATGQEAFEQQASMILKLQHDNDILIKELLKKDRQIGQLYHLKYSLERDLFSVKSILEVAQNGVFTFCKNVLKSQNQSRSPTSVISKVNYS